MYGRSLNEESNMRPLRAALLPVTVLVALVVFVRAQQPSVPRPEHPQPQFQRERWMTLNGDWQFDFDDKNAGLEEGWATSARAFGRTIKVPYCFESQLSGIGDTSFHPWLWYRRTFTVPADWKGQRVLLNFGAVDYRARVWVNGQLIGTHEGGETPFRFDATRLVKTGPNTMTVRVEDMPTDRSIPRGKQYWEPKSRGIFYTRTSGIWQPVWLEAAGDAYLESVKIDASVEGAVRFEAAIARPQTDLELRAVVRSAVPVGAPGAATRPAATGAPPEITSATARVSGTRAVVGVVVADPRLWTPRSPNLYDVTFELRRGSTVLDRVQSYFGFRTVGIEDGRVTLNHNPVYLKLVLDQGYWPESVMTPPTDEAIQRDIRLAKEMGFNGARKHQKVEDPRYLYWADRLGFLVSGEMPNAYVFTDEYVSRMTREWMEALLRDRNHPSIVIWAPLNESWGVPNLRDPRQQAHLKELYWLTHTLDDSRLVIDNEGWEHTDATDVFAIHDYARTGDVLLERYKGLGSAQALAPGTPIPSAGTPVLVAGYRYNGSPVYLSEFGGIAFVPPGHQVPGDAWGYAGVEKSVESALERMRGLYAAIARIPAFAGVCYTQLTDVEQEVNGLLTNDRKPKFDTKAVRDINDLLR
jgi:beta-galactosidase/beta-glucuronidase